MGGIHRVVCMSFRRCWAFMRGNLHRPYGFGRNGTVFGVAPPQNVEALASSSLPQIRYRCTPKSSNAISGGDHLGDSAPVMKALIAILFFCLTAPAQAQSLADLAREERARREKTAVARLAVEGRVFTNVHLRPAPPLVVPPPVVDAESPEGEGAGASEGMDLETPNEPAAPTPEETRAAWEAAVSEQQSVVQDFEDQEVRQQLEISRIRNVFVAPVTTAAEKNSAEVQMVVAEAALAQIRIDLDEARAALEDLQALEPPAP